MERTLRRRLSEASAASARVERQLSGESQESYQNASQNSYTEFAQVFDNVLNFSAPSAGFQLANDSSSAIPPTSSIATRTRSSTLTISVLQSANATSATNAASAASATSATNAASATNALLAPRSLRSARSPRSAVSYLSTDSPTAFSIGIVTIVRRPSTNRKQKPIKWFALQKSFYAYPRDISDATMEKLNTRIENDIADFKLQGYEVETHTFGLPFKVEEICCVSRGYNLLPKILKAPKIVGKKRKTISDDDESSDSDKNYEDDDEPMTDATAATTITTETKNKKSKK